MEQITVQQMTCARLPTDEGTFQLCLYHSNRDDKEHMALIMGDVVGQEDVLVRVHSECFTGDVLGSLRCDCGSQLTRAMQMVAREGRGVIIYLRQEGRGIGLLDKLRAYNLQDMGYDTVDANLLLGHQADARDYTIAALILQDLDVRSLRLLTNNPSKIESLQALGLTVVTRVPLHTRVTNENAAYLATKVARMRHLLNMELLSTQTGKPVPFTSSTKSDVSQAARRPFVTLSYAQSLDGSIATQGGQPMVLSSPESLILTHKLRASHDAILVGIGTVLADDPRLNVRLVEGRDPQPVVVDSQLRMPLQAQLLRDAALPPWIAATPQADAARQRALEAVGARILRLPADQDGRVDLAALLTRLAEMGIASLMVEGGAQIITSFLENHLVDRLVLTVAPILVGGRKGVHRLNLLHFPRLRSLRYQWLGDDMVVLGDVSWEEGAADFWEKSDAWYGA